MALSFGGAGDAQVATGVVGCHWLVEMDFLSGTQRLTTAPVNVVVSSTTYTGLGKLMQVAPLAESEDNTAAKLVISATVVDSALFAAVLGPATEYRGRPVRLYLQLFTEGFAPVGTKVHRWTGTMEPVRITRRVQAGGPSSGRIEMPCTRNGMSRARNYQGLRLTHAQQQAIYPADLGLEYLQALIEKPTLWLSKRFQEIQ